MAKPLGKIHALLTDQRLILPASTILKCIIRGAL